MSRHGAGRGRRKQEARGRGGVTHIYGIGPVSEALVAERRVIHRVWVVSTRQLDARVGPIVDMARDKGVSVEGASKQDLDSLAGSAVHQGVVAEADRLPRLELADLLVPTEDGPVLLLALDGVQDPQNLGAILRSAAGAGARGVIVPKDRRAPLTPAAVKVAEGAAEYVPVVEVTNLRRALDELREDGVWAVGLEADAPTEWSDLELDMPTVLVLGSEGSGIRPLVKKGCDHIARIPIVGKIGSLNVAAAAAVVLFEAVRQRRHKGRSGA